MGIGAGIVRRVAYIVAFSAYGKWTFDSGRGAMAPDTVTGHSCAMQNDAAGSLWVERVGVGATPSC